MTPEPAFCQRCGRETPTVFLPLTGGLFGNCCAICRTCRKGRPYASRREYEQSLMPPRADGGQRERQHH